MLIVVPRSVVMTKSKMSQHSHPGIRGHYPLGKVPNKVTPKMESKKGTILSNHRFVTERAATSCCRYVSGTENGTKKRTDFGTASPESLKIAEASGNSLRRGNDPPRTMCLESSLKQSLLRYATETRLGRPGSTTKNTRIVPRLISQHSWGYLL